MDLDSVSVHKHAKKELGQYPAILTSHLVNNPYIFHRTPINYLLVNLAVADMLYATFITTSTFLADGMGNTVVCKLLTGGVLAWIAGISSVVTLIAIAAERYCAVIYPAGNIAKLTKSKLKVRHSNY